MRVDPSSQMVISTVALGSTSTDADCCLFLSSAAIMEELTSGLGSQIWQSLEGKTGERELSNSFQDKNNSCKSASAT